MIKKNIYGDDLKARLLAGTNDRIYNFMIADNKVRGAILNGTRMVNEMRANHNLGILETLVLGHAYLGCCLLSANLKGNDLISIGIECSGPIKGLSVEANAYGEVRGYLKKNPIEVESPLDDFNMSKFFGAGFLTVTKYLEDAKSPFSGRVALQYGNIAEDLAYYFFTSEQIPTVFNLSIQFDSKGDVIGASGLFLQIMPNASDEMIVQIEKLVQNFPSLGEKIAQGDKPDQLIKEYFSNYSPSILSNERIEFFCRCTEKKFLNYISKLPKKELKGMLDEESFPITICCHNCNSMYRFDKKIIEQLASV